MSVRHKVQHQFGSLWVRGVHCRPLEPDLIPGCPPAPLNLLRVPTEITRRSYDSLTPWNASLGPPPHPKVYISPSTIARVTEDWWSFMQLHQPPPILHLEHHPPWLRYRANKLAQGWISRTPTAIFTVSKSNKCWDFRPFLLWFD